MENGKVLMVLVVALGIACLSLGEAVCADKTPSPGGRGAKPPIMPALSAAPPRTLALPPFYLIHEKGAKVWIERVIVTVEVAEAMVAVTTFDKPEHRSQIFDILSAASENGPLPSVVQTVLNQSLEEAPVTSVRLSRSFLLF